MGIHSGGQHRGIAQLVEQWSPKPRAEGSNPSAPATFPQAGQPVHADIAQSAEHILGKDEVISSNLIISSKENSRKLAGQAGLREFFIF